MSIRSLIGLALSVLRTRSLSFKLALCPVFLLAVASTWPFFKEREAGWLMKDFYMSENVFDPGPQLLFRIYQRLVSFILPGHGFTAVDLFAWELAILLLFSLVTILPRVPLFVSAGAQLSLFALWLVFRDIADIGHAVDSWAIVLVSVLLVGLLQSKGKPADFAAFAFSGAVLGTLPLMRQSAHLTIALPFLSVFLFPYLFRGQEEPDKKSTLRPRNLALPLIVLFAAVFSVHFSGAALWTAMTGKPFKSHGMGHILGGLGMANNPYNITWDDDCAMAQGLLAEDRPWFDYQSDSQRKLIALWGRIVAEDPALLISSVAAKGAYVLRYLSGSMDREKTRCDGYPRLPSPLLLALSLLWCAAAAFCIFTLFRTGGRSAALLAAGSAGLLAATLAPHLVFVPFYLGSCVAFMLASLLVLAPVFFAFNIDERSRPGPLPAARGLKALFFVCVAVALAACGYTLFRGAVNRKESQALLAGNPLEVIHSMGLGYVPRFNRLPAEEQKQLVFRLFEQRQGNVVFFSGRGPEPWPGEIFHPVLCVTGKNALFVVAWLSDKWRMTLPGRVQGPRNSVLRVMKNCDAGPPVLPYMTMPYNHWKIADANWDGRYRIFAIPQPPGYAEGALFFHASAHNFKAGSHVGGPYNGLLLEELGGERLLLP